MRERHMLLGGNTRGINAFDRRNECVAIGSRVRLRTKSRGYPCHIWVSAYLSDWGCPRKGWECYCWGVFSSLFRFKSGFSAGVGEVKHDAGADAAGACAEDRHRMMQRRDKQACSKLQKC